MQKTLDYYNRNARKFAEGTAGVDFTGIQNRFLSYLPERALILDFGCGSGRDTVALEEQGYLVTAMDGAKRMCELAEIYTDRDVLHLTFEEMDFDEVFDGIWACASLLQLEMETDESWYNCFYHHLRAEMDEYYRAKRCLRVVTSGFL